MIKRIKSCLVSVFVIFFLSGIASHASDDSNDTMPKLISSGQDFVIYQFRGFVESRMVESVIRSGIVIAHINLESGKLKWLVSTGEHSIPTHRISYSVSRLVGLREHGRYLIVIVYRSGTIFTQDNRPPLDLDPKKGQYTLQVFSEKEGREIYKWDFMDPWEFPESIPMETTGAGVIENTGQWYAVFGNMFQLNEAGEVIREKKHE